MLGFLVKKLSEGEVMTIVGPFVSRVTVMDFEAELPAGSVSVILIVLEPSVSVTGLVLSAPSTLYITVMGDVFVVELSAGDVITITGAIVSKEPVTDLDDELPNESDSVMVKVLEPSVKVKLFILAVPSEV